MQAAIRRRVGAVPRWVDPYYSGPPSDHFDGLRFFNPDHPETDRSLRDLVRWKLKESSAHIGNAPYLRQRQPRPSPHTGILRLLNSRPATAEASSHSITIAPSWICRRT